MARKIARIAASQVHNQPQLILASELSSICAYIEKRNTGYVWKESLEEAARQVEQLGWDEEGNYLPYSVENGIAIINISGSLTYKPTMWSALCGGCSYLDLQEAADKIAKDPSISTVVLEIDSGGGQAYGVFETAEYIKKTIKTSNKKLITYVDGMMASAAYALGCIADEVIMNPDAQAGSIGVVVHLEDESEKKRMEGEKDIWVFAGDSKVPFAEDGSFKQEFLDDLQKSVNDTYTKFTGHVASMRSIPNESVVATQAKVFKTQDAIKLGLADKEMTREEFANYLADLVNAEVELPNNTSNYEDDKEEEKAKAKLEFKLNEGQSLSTKEDEVLQVLDIVEEQASVISQMSAEEFMALKNQAKEAETLKAQLAEFKAAQEQAQAEIAQKAEAELKDQYKTVVMGLGFVTEDKQEAVVDAIFKIKASLGEEAGVILEQLETARNTIEEMKTHLTQEQGLDAPETVVDETEQEKATKDLDAKIREKYQSQLTTFK